MKGKLNTILCTTVCVSTLLVSGLVQAAATELWNGGHDASDTGSDGMGKRIECFTVAQGLELNTVSIFASNSNTRVGWGNAAIVLRDATDSVVAQAQWSSFAWADGNPWRWIGMEGLHLGAGNYKMEMYGVFDSYEPGDFDSLFAVARSTTSTQPDGYAMRGNGTLLAGDYLTAFTTSAAPVPEPAGMLALVTGFAGLLGKVIHRKR